MHDRDGKGGGGGVEDVSGVCRLDDITLHYIEYLLSSAGRNSRLRDVINELG